MATKLLPCPFCGGRPEPARHIDGGGVARVQCIPCQFYGPMGLSREWAARNWNRRAITRRKEGVG